MIFAVGTLVFNLTYTESYRNQLSRIFDEGWIEDEHFVADYKSHNFPRAKITYDAGADATSLGMSAEDHYWKKTIEYAHSRNLKVIADFVGCRNIAETMLKLSVMGVDILNIGMNMPGQNDADFEDPLFLKIGRLVAPKCELAVAGGINKTNIEKIAKHKPDIVIVGRGINEDLTREKLQG